MLKNNDIKKKVNISMANACPLRILDSVKLKNYFKFNNFEIVNDYLDADYCLFITCSATMPDINRQLEKINEIKSLHSNLFVLGCLPGANSEELQKVFSGIMISTKNINEIDNYFPDFRIKYNDIPEAHHYDYDNYVFSEINNGFRLGSSLLKFGLSNNFFRHINRQLDIKKFYKLNKGLKTSVPCFLKICSGCINNCSYCNIRDAVGKLKSKSIETLTSEYSSLLEKGFRQYYFVAEDICSYGLDIKSSLTHLLNSLNEIDKNIHTKWSLEGVNPAWLVKNQEFLYPFIQSKKIWEITLSVEHGSNRIIKLMNRHYLIDDVIDVLKKLRELNNGLKINAMLIEGFPSETEEDFQGTLGLLQKIRFDCVTVSSYSEFEKRESSKIFPKVNKNELNERLHRIKKLLEKNKTPIIRGDI